jgi:tRNA-Thr(GGU) m(6)t(6)A37 methyltransferase TsaA
MDIEPIGVVRSELVDLGEAPRQGDEGAPDAWLEIEEAVRPGLAGISVGAELMVLTWFDRARRDVVSVRPRGDSARPETGVFLTRSPDRPNPIGVHRVTVVEVESGRLRVGPLEAVDGTPVVDIKPVLGSVAER